MLYLFTKLVKFWYTNKQKVAKIALFYVLEMEDKSGCKKSIARVWFEEIRGLYVKNKRNRKRENLVE